MGTKESALNAFVAWTKAHPADWPLGKVVVNGKFDRFMDPDTDTAWMGFFAGWVLGLTAPPIDPTVTGPIQEIIK